MTAVRVFGPEKSTKAVIPWNARLDGVTMRLRLQYIERCDRWDIRMALQSGDLITAGQRITLGFDLFTAYNDSRLPNGQLFVIDSQATYDTHPGRNGWRERFWFMYETREGVVVDNELTTTQIVTPPQ